MSELSIEERLRRIELKLDGKCPTCGRKVKDWEGTFGSFAPEIWASLDMQGIDPETGHLKTCLENRR